MILEKQLLLSIKLEIFISQNYSQMRNIKGRCHSSKQWTSQQVLPKGKLRNALKFTDFVELHEYCSLWQCNFKKTA